VIPTPSDPTFRVLHALRIKGFAKSSAVAELTGLAIDEVDALLAALADDRLVGCREVRRLWQLTPKGDAIHRQALVHEQLRTAGRDGRDLEAAHAYVGFMQLNDRFKQLCTDWQVRDGRPNDHLDPDYDAQVIERLAALHADAAPVLDRLCNAIDRFAPYRDRLASTCRRVREGDTTMFTGVMCGSYHDVWMELHEDLIVTQRLDSSRSSASSAASPRLASTSFEGAF
jgi:uncharacterized protein YaaQ